MGHVFEVQMILKISPKILYNPEKYVFESKKKEKICK